MVTNIAIIPGGGHSYYYHREMRGLGEIISCITIADCGFKQPRVAKQKTWFLFGAWLFVFNNQSLRSVSLYSTSLLFPVVVILMTTTGK